MSTTVWPFTWARPYSERRSRLTTRLEGNTGIMVRRSEYGPHGLFLCTGRLVFPAGGKSIADWHEFIHAIEGGAESFLVKAHLSVHKTKTLESVGTGDGVTVAFALDCRYIDASTLLVYKDAVLQTLTTHYTVSGNNTAPIITFVSAPGNGLAITATYDYYYPVVLASDDAVPRDRNPTGVDATSGWVIDEVPLREEFAGAHRVDPDTA